MGPVKLLKLSAWLVRQSVTTTPVVPPQPQAVITTTVPITNTVLPVNNTTIIPMNKVIRSQVSPSTSTTSTAVSSPRGSSSGSPRGSRSDSLRYSFDSSCLEFVDMASDIENPSNSNDVDDEDIFELDDVRKMLSVIRNMTE